MATLLLGVLLAAPPGAARAAEKEKHVRFTANALPVDPFSPQNDVSAKPEFRRGQPFLFVLAGKPAEGWHTYPIDPRKLVEGQPALPSQVRLTNAREVAAIGPTTESPPEKVLQKDGSLATEYEHPFNWTIEMLVRPDAPPGQTNVEVEVELQVCNPSVCVAEKHTLSVPLTISSQPPLELTADAKQKLAAFDETWKKEEEARRKQEDARKAASSGTPTPTASGAPFNPLTTPIQDHTGGESSGGPPKDTGLWATILTAIVGGFVSLLTPCVFPMIPVTVSYFLKQGERKEHRALTMAAVYCTTIVAVLTIGGIALVRVLQVISQHYLTNIFLTAVFVFFALSLLGMYEIQLPSGLANLTGSREGKGGLAGIVFMALTFSIISFACVGPIYGGFITLEASSSSGLGNWLHRFLGPFAFSLAFASPFFVLALFPSLLRSMPRSGSWMNSVKVVMGFLELAAALKFVRAAELNLRGSGGFFTFDLCLGIYVALCVACGLYLFNVYRLPHDHGAPDSISVPRLVFALGFLSLGLYLTPGMFKENKDQSQKPRGVIYDWVQSFLLPESGADPGWLSNLAVAIEQAQRENKPLFIDFTGVG
jgi:thiol:disulfide interchange protein